MHCVHGTINKDPDLLAWSGPHSYLTPARPSHIDQLNDINCLSDHFSLLPTMINAQPPLQQCIPPIS